MVVAMFNKLDWARAGRVRSMPQQAENERIRKRQVTISRLKQEWQYQEWPTERERPATPDPRHQELVSKRTWERRIVEWKRELQQGCLDEARFRQRSLVIETLRSKWPYQQWPKWKERPVTPDPTDPALKSRRRWNSMVLLWNRKLKQGCCEVSPPPGLYLP